MTDVQAREEVARLVRELGYEPGALQWKWRKPETLPAEFDRQEAEAALLDAFVTMGGATAWRGDGSGCAWQIIEAVWHRKRDQAT